MASELRTRTLSGIILASAAIALTVWSFESFAAMCAVGGGILMKEWWGLTKHRGIGWVLLGIVYIGLGILSLLIWHGAGDTLYLLFALVWGGDTAAYLIGRKWGKHKIAPAISPGKSWEGLAAATLTCFAIGFCAEYFNGAYASPDEASLPGRLPYALSVGAISMIFAPIGLLGDLFESSLKRHAGVKDSGKLIPGHGGLFDRVDALLACAIFTLLAYLGMYVYAIAVNHHGGGMYAHESF